MSEENKQARRRTPDLFSTSAYRHLMHLRHINGQTPYRFLYFNPFGTNYALEDIPEVIENIQVFITSHILPNFFLFTEFPAFSGAASPRAALLMPDQTTDFYRHAALEVKMRGMVEETASDRRRLKFPHDLT